MTALTHSALDGKWEEARALHAKYHPLFRGMFIDTNPIPVKAAMAMMGLVEEVYRLPMCSMGDEQKKQLAATLKDVGLL
jgi:4-hydroxy-tetrahydrodipicolinate synthase